MIKPELVPTPEDWQALQGGKPRIFESPTGGSYEIVHVYGNEYDPGSKLPQYGCVIGTTAERFLHSIAEPTELEFYNTLLSRPQQRIVRLPATMLIKHHGNECADRSYKSGSRNGNNAYEKLASSAEFADYLGRRAYSGYREQRLSVDPLGKGYRIIPLVKMQKQSR